MPYDHTKTPPGESRQGTSGETKQQTPSDEQPTPPDDPSAEKLSTSWLWIIWAAAAVVAIGVFVVDWMWRHPSANTLEFEVAKASLQALAVALIAGLVTIATTRFTHLRESITEIAEKKHQKRTEEAERKHKEFEKRVAILDRASGCAQKMFASCEHLRLLRKYSEIVWSPGVSAQVSSKMTRHLPRYFRIVTELLQMDRSPKRAKKKELAEARVLLDKAYVDFYLDAEGLLLELGARYGNDEAEQAAPENRKTEQAASKDKTIEQTKPGNAYKQWQKIEYLLIVYYLILCGNVRRVMEQKTASGEPLSEYLQLDEVNKLQEKNKAEPQNLTDQELSAIRQEIREKYSMVMPALTEAILQDDFTTHFDVSRFFKG